MKGLQHQLVLLVSRCFALHRASKDGILPATTSFADIRGAGSYVIWPHSWDMFVVEM